MGLIFNTKACVTRGVLRKISFHNRKISKLRMGHFDIYKFEFVEYLRDICIKNMKNQPKFEIFLEYLENQTFSRIILDL